MILSVAHYLGHYTTNVGVTADNLDRGVYVFTHGTVLDTKSSYGCLISFIGGDDRGMQFDTVHFTSTNQGVVAGEVWKRVRTSLSGGWGAWTKMG